MIKIPFYFVCVLLTSIILFLFEIYGAGIVGDVKVGEIPLLLEYILDHEMLFNLILPPIVTSAVGNIWIFFLGGKNV